MGVARPPRQLWSLEGSFELVAIQDLEVHVWIIGASANLDCSA